MFSMKPVDKMREIIDDDDDDEDDDDDANNDDDDVDVERRMSLIC